MHFAGTHAENASSRSGWPAMLSGNLTRIMSTRGLSIPHLSPSQSNNAVSVNVDFDMLDSASTQESVIDVSGGVDVDPKPSQAVPFVSLKLGPNPDARHSPDLAVVGAPVRDRGSR